MASPEGDVTVSFDEFDTDAVRCSLFEKRHSRPACTGPWCLVCERYTFLTKCRQVGVEIADAKRDVMEHCRPFNRHEIGCDLRVPLDWLDEFHQALADPDERDIDAEFRYVFDGAHVEAEEFEQVGVVVDILDEDTEVVDLGDHR